MPKIPIDIKQGTIQKLGTVVGIDLGTTHSLVAFYNRQVQKSEIIPDNNGKNLLPSVVHLPSKKVGFEAQAYLMEDSQNTVFSVKRLIGKNLKDVEQYINFYPFPLVEKENDGQVYIQSNNENYNPIDVSSMLLKQLKNNAEAFLGTPVYQAVITVPAYFNDSQRQATRHAAQLAGLDVLRLVNEPTAACLAYGLHQDLNNATVMVYDLGGGTFDVSILQMVEGVFEVIATAGDTLLGGDDIDKAIMQYWIAQDNIVKNIKELRLLAEEAKKFVSTKQTFIRQIENVELRLEVETLRELCKPIIQKTINCCQSALKDASLSKNNIDALILVGGSTRMPIIQESLQFWYGKECLFSINPDYAIALGAAVQADILSGNNKDFLLLDITPLSLGIETMGGLMDVLIPRNSKVPCRASRQYTTQKDGQSAIKISVYQGERDMVSDNRKLADFELRGIPAMPAGLAKVEVQFILDPDGVLKVQAKELRSGIAQHIEIKSQYGLTDIEVENMLQNSLDNAQVDQKQRALVHAQQEASQLVYTVENFVLKNKEALNNEEVIETEKLTIELRHIILNGSIQEIQSKTDVLNQYTASFAERLMNSAIKTALQGTKI